MPKLYKLIISYIIWDKVFKNGPSKICGRAFKKFYLVHS